MKLSLLSIDKGGFVSVGAEGTITAADFHVDQKNPFEVVLGPAWPTHRVIFDMKQVNFMDSSAIGWLIDSNKSFHGGGGRLVIHSIQPKVKQVIDLLRLNKAFAIADNDATARTLMNGESK